MKIQTKETEVPGSYKGNSLEYPPLPFATVKLNHRLNDK
jgi:hypothetical protein